MKEKIIDFINNNNISITNCESNDNSSYCILVGYSLYLGSDINELYSALDELGLEYDSEELDRVWIYAEYRDYGDWWKDESNRNQYKL